MTKSKFDRNLKFKICAFHMRNFFCAFLKRKSYTSCDCLWIRGFLQKSFSVCKNVISYFCESAVREWQYQRKFNFNISCFGAEAKFGSKQLFQKINFGNNSWKQWKRMVWSASKHGALVFVSCVSPCAKEWPRGPRSIRFCTFFIYDGFCSRTR